MNNTKNQQKTIKKYKLICLTDECEWYLTSVYQTVEEQKLNGWKRCPKCDHILTFNGIEEHSILNRTKTNIVYDKRFN